jgi:hypothetical protein
MSDNKTFTKAIFFRMPSANAPDFVIGRLSLKRSEFVSWLETQDENMSEDWLNMEILHPKNPEKKPYIKVSTWKPNSDNSTVNSSADDFNQEPAPEPVPIIPDNNDDLPF